MTNNKDNIKRIDFTTGFEIPPIEIVAQSYFGMIKATQFSSYGLDCMGYRVKDVLDYIEECIERQSEVIDNE